jgi:RHS repeat-associated protein
LYDAAGTKLRKTVRTNGTVTYVQDYLAGGIEYRQTGAAGTKRVESVFHPEGRYFNVNAEVSTTISWRREYNIKDHLGNTRVVITDRDADGVLDITGSAATNEVLQEQHYYAFGLGFEGPWVQNDAASRDNKYLYNGKELNDDFGLGWNDYGARWYDPAIARWGGVDPLADKMRSSSTFIYSLNNPLRYIDPTGLAPTDIVYFNLNGEEVYRKVTPEVHKTFVATTSGDSYLKNQADLNANLGWNTTAFEEAKMPGVITMELNGNQPENPEYQSLDHEIAAQTHLFNRDLEAGNLNFDNEHYQVGEKATELDPNLVKSLAYKESGLGLGQAVSTKPSDVLSMYNPGDAAGKAKIGLTSSDISSGGTTSSSIKYGIKWLHFKGYVSADGKTKDFKGWFVAITRFGPGKKEPKYLEVVMSIYNSVRPATPNDY